MQHTGMRVRGVMVTGLVALTALSAPVTPGAAAPAAAAAGHSKNLLVNPGFTGGHLGGWKDRSSKRQALSAGPEAGVPDGANALRVRVEKAGGGSHGQLVQFVKVRPDTVYRFSARVKADFPEMAYLQVKQMRGKSEGARLSSPSNRETGTWETVQCEVKTGADTDALQVLLRFRMNDRCVGKSAWFSALQLTAADDGDTPPPPFVPPPPPKAVEPQVAPPGRDVYVTPAGAGRGDGTDWANAMAAQDGGLQRAWEQTGPGNTLFLSGGFYGAETLSVAQGGASLEAPRRLCGVDRGVPDCPRPVFTGTWSPEKPASGPVFVTLQPGACFVTLDNIEVRRYKSAVVARGPNHGLRLLDVDTRECRDAVWLDGGATPALPESGSRDIVLDGCDALRYTKRALRTLGGVRRLRVRNCRADAGGEAYAHEVFPVGYHVLGGKGGVVDKDIVFENVEAVNNWHNAGEKYWNADGFAAERASEDITFIRCRAQGNTDGGWDVKSLRPVWIDCVGTANKRNFRVWNQPEGAAAVFSNCVSEASTDYGKLGHDVGFWIKGGGRAELIRCETRRDRVPLSVETKDPEQASSLLVSGCRLESTGRPWRLDGKVAVENRGSSLSWETPAAPAP